MVTKGSEQKKSLRDLIKNVRKKKIGNCQNKHPATSVRVQKKKSILQIHNGKNLVVQHPDLTPLGSRLVKEELFIERSRSPNETRATPDNVNRVRLMNNDRHSESKMSNKMAEALIEASKVIFNERKNHSKEEGGSSNGSQRDENGSEIQQEFQTEGLLSMNPKVLNSSLSNLSYHDRDFPQNFMDITPESSSSKQSQAGEQGEESLTDPKGDATSIESLSDENYSRSFSLDVSKIARLGDSSPIEDDSILNFH